jgi:hypothetical protein
MTTTTKPNKAIATKVLKAVQAKYKYDNPTYGPQLRMDFDWFGHGASPAIVWEGGPYDWASECSFELLKVLPKGVWLEPATSWALNIYVEI